MSNDQPQQRISGKTRSSLTKSEEQSLKKAVDKVRKEVAKKPNKQMDFKECL